jgi:hypothetical protein
VFSPGPGQPHRRPAALAQSNSKPPAPKQATPGPEQCTALLSNRDGRQSVLKIPRRFLEADAAGWLPDSPRSPLATGVIGVALAAAVSLAGVGLARSRHRRALVGSAACVLAGLLLVNTSCSRIPHRDDLPTPARDGPEVENLTPQDRPTGRAVLVDEGMPPVVHLDVGENLRSEAMKAAIP